MDRYREANEHEELRFGIVACAIANYAGKILKDGAKVTPADFMPLLHAKKRAQERALPLDFINQQIRCFLLSQANVLNARNGTQNNGA
jgi:hypothetical protein